MGSPALAENSWKDNYRDIRNLKYQMREWISEISMLMGSPLAENSWKDQSRQLLRNQTYGSKNTKLEIQNEIMEIRNIKEKCLWARHWQRTVGNAKVDLSIL